MEYKAWLCSKKGSIHVILLTKACSFACLRIVVLSTRHLTTANKPFDFRFSVEISLVSLAFSFLILPHLALFKTI